MKIACDTNVLISGILFGGHARRILSLTSQGILTNVTSPSLLREAEAVLLRPKFGLQPEQVSRIVALFRDTFELTNPSRQLHVIDTDPEDNRVLESADAASAEVIISGDKHLLDHKKWNSIRVLSPAAFIKETGSYLKL